jgi:hypothetical protein
VPRERQRDGEQHERQLDGGPFDQPTRPDPGGRRDRGDEHRVSGEGQEVLAGRHHHDDREQHRGDDLHLRREAVHRAVVVEVQRVRVTGAHYWPAC